MRILKHLPIDQWPAADRAAWNAAFVAGDIFDDDGGPGAHLSPGSRQSITRAYRRWLGFLAATHPAALREPPDRRITLAMLEDFIDHLSEGVSVNTVAIFVTQLSYAARLIAPETDWAWLRSLKSRLVARTRSNDRFDRLVPPWRILDHGIALMDSPGASSKTVRMGREIAFRDGLQLALLSLWPIRRRSLAALTVSGHVERRGESTCIVLHPEDTKSGRAESFQVPDVLLDYVARYLDRIRPILLGDGTTDAFWVSSRGNAMCGQQLYERARRTTRAAFGRAMALQDFRRAAPTFVAMEAPEKIGIIPGVLQHASPEVGERYYNLSRSTAASRRQVAHVSNLRESLRGAWRRQQRNDPKCVP